MTKASLINELEIQGNSKADALAELGANFYAIDEQVLDAIQRRTAVTMLI